MKKVKYLLFILFCVFLFPLNALAKCDYQRMAELNKIASNVQFSYSYEVDENSNPIFSVNVSNVTPDIYVVDENGNRFGNLDNLVTYDVLGGTISYKVYSNDVNCYGEKLLSKSVTLPMFNAYSNYYKCKEHSDFKYCVTWLDTSSLSTETFEKELSNYLFSDKKNDNNLDENKNSFDFSILALFLIILTVTTVFAILIIFIKRRRYYNEK